MPKKKNKALSNLTLNELIRAKYLVKKPHPDFFGFEKGILAEELTNHIEKFILLYDCFLLCRESSYHDFDLPYDGHPGIHWYLVEKIKNPVILDLYDRKYYPVLMEGLSSNKENINDLFEETAENYYKQIEDVLEKIDPWIESQKNILNIIAKKLFSKRKISYYRNVYLDVTLPDMEKDETFIESYYRFLYIIFVAILLRRNPHPVLPKLSKKAISLAKNLHKELDSCGIKMNSSNILAVRNIAQSEPWGLSKKISSNEHIKMIVYGIGFSMQNLFCLENTSKGRPYPDVVVEILKYVGFEIDIRQANRLLKTFDQ